jgi:hypothetical protein
MPNTPENSPPEERKFLRNCKICTHPKIELIENDILSSVAYTAIIDKYSSKSHSFTAPSIRRHYKDHMGAMDSKTLSTLEDNKNTQALATLEGLGDLYVNLNDLGKHVMDVKTEKPSEEFQKASTIVKIVDLQLKLILAGQKTKEGDIREGDKSNKDITVIFETIRDRNKDD